MSKDKTNHKRKEEAELFCSKLTKKTTKTPRLKQALVFVLISRTQQAIKVKDLFSS